MIVTNGNSIKGIWRISDYTTFEVGDIVIGYLTNGTAVFAPVASNFTTGQNATLEQYKDHLSVYNPDAEQFITKIQLAEYIGEKLKYFSISGSSSLITGAIRSVTVPGVYQLGATSTDLPASYSSDRTLDTTKVIVRVTTSENSKFYELLDFKNNCYFISAIIGSDTIDWTELTGANVAAVSGTIEDNAAQVLSTTENVMNILNDVNNRIQYKVLDSISTDSDNTIVGLFSEGEVGYLVNLAVRESSSTTSYTRKYSIRIEVGDTEGFVYDEYGTIRVSSHQVKLGTGVSLTSIYKIV